MDHRRHGCFLRAITDRLRDRDRPSSQPFIDPTPPRCGAPPEGPGKSGLRTARAQIDRSIGREGAVGEFEGLLLILLFLSKAGGPRPGVRKCFWKCRASKPRSSSLPGGRDRLSREPDREQRQAAEDATEPAVVGRAIDERREAKHGGPELERARGAARGGAAENPGRR